MQKKYIIITVVIIVSALLTSTLLYVLAPKRIGQNSEINPAQQETPTQKKQHAEREMKNARDKMSRGDTEAALKSFEMAQKLYSELKLTDEAQRAQDEVNSLKTMPSSKPNEPAKTPEPISPKS